MDAVDRPPGLHDVKKSFNDICCGNSGFLHANIEILSPSIGCLPANRKPTAGGFANIHRVSADPKCACNKCSPNPTFALRRMAQKMVSASTAGQVGHCIKVRHMVHQAAPAAGCAKSTKDMLQVII